MVWGIDSLKRVEVQKGMQMVISHHSDMFTSP